MTDDDEPEEDEPPPRNERPRWRPRVGRSGSYWYPGSREYREERAAEAETRRDEEERR